MPTATSPSVDSSISARTLADNDTQMPRGTTREYCICPQFLPLLLSLGSTSFTAQDAEAAVTVHAADHIGTLAVTLSANEEQPSAVMADKLRSWWSWRLRALLRLIIVRACAAAAEIRDGDGSCDLRVLDLELLRIFGLTRGSKNYASMRADIWRVAWLLSAADFHYRLHSTRGDKELAFRILDGFDKLEAEHSGLVLHVSRQLRGVLGGLGLLASRRRRGRKTVARQICGHFIDLRCFALGGRRGRNSCFNISLEIAMHLVYLRNIRRGPRGREGKISLASLLEASPDLRELHDMYVTSPRKQRSPKRFNAHIAQAAAELVKSQIFDRAVYRDEILYFKFCR